MWIRAAALLVGVCLLACVAAVGRASVVTDDADLRAMRAGRRAAMRVAVASSEQPAVFVLLVIPVDFADERLHPGWQPADELGPRLFPLVGESLASYFDRASRGHLELDVVLAPLIHLAGEKHEYSDEGYAGFSRTRMLATEAIEGAAAGLDFRLLDNDGPDRLAGSVDDDGEIDGVLILHSGIGDENDMEAGVIQALSFYLDEPITRDGVIASSYSVASLRSGIGIWAHETAHLFGLEDRYDYFLPTPAGEVLSRGGLGIFSLMAAGAWGPAGDGAGAALLDAYSAAQLGWCRIVDRRGDGSTADTLRSVLKDGLAWRVWTKGQSGSEYFLLETRGDAAAAPFDAGIEAGHLLITHVDESLPEGQQTSSPRHIRVAVLEADGDWRLAGGEDPGNEGDLFPGAGEVSEVTPFTDPSTWGYSGASEVSLTGISSISDGVVVCLKDFDSPGVDVDFAFTGDSPRSLSLRVEETGTLLAAMQTTVSVIGAEAWGAFAGGALSIDVTMERFGDTGWRPDGEVLWYPEAVLPPGAKTIFAVAVSSGMWPGETVYREWNWTESATVVDFSDTWPGEWLVLQSGDDRTTWQRWTGVETPAVDHRPMLACTGAEFPTAEAWPEVTYHNNADVVLLSGPLPETTAAITLLHAFDGEAVRDGMAADGAVVEFMAADGTVVAVEPVDGYGGVLDPGSTCGLHGRPAFAGVGGLGENDVLRWRLDAFPVPVDAARPVRLRLRLASDSVWRGRGWFVAGIETLTHVPGSFLDLRWLPAEGVLRWHDSSALFETWGVEARAVGQSDWSMVWSGSVEASGADIHALSLSEFEEALPPAGHTRNLLRIYGVASVGDIVSHAVVVYRDGGAGAPQLLGNPYLDVATGSVRLLIDLPSQRAGELSIYDVRGRLLRDWRLIGGRQFMEWNGCDSDDRRVGAGVYLFMLDMGGTVATRKVVLLR